MKDANLPIESPIHSAKSRWLRAGVKGIPYLGASLDELLFAHMDEFRWKRLEQTLSELGELMRKAQTPADATEKEQFGRLLESVAPAVARSTLETKRTMFRELLLNSVCLEQKDPAWESARFAAELLDTLDFAAIEILCALAKLGAFEGGPIAEVHVPPPPARPAVMLAGASSPAIIVDYDRHVVDSGYRQLTDPKARLVVVGAHGRNCYEHVAITDLGAFLIHWTTRHA